MSSEANHLPSSDIDAKGDAKLVAAINERNATGKNVISEQDREALRDAFEKLVMVTCCSRDAYCDIVIMKEFQRRKRGLPGNDIRRFSAVRRACARQYQVRRRSSRAVALDSGMHSPIPFISSPHILANPRTRLPEPTRRKECPMKTLPTFYGPNSHVGDSLC
jgi:hypothetical protein